jgi:hypothetical protein
MGVGEMNWKYWILIIALCIAITFILADKFYWDSKLEPVQEVKYYILTWEDEDLRQIQRQWRIVEILTSDLYRQGIISWECDSLLKELDKEWILRSD